MSYAHDICLALDYDRAEFAAAVSDIRTLFRRAELPIAGPGARPGTTPVLDADFVGFNGVNQDCVCDPDDPDYHGLDVCWNATCWSFHRGENVGQPFVIDLKPNRPYGITQMDGRY